MPPITNATPIHAGPSTIVYRLDASGPRARDAEVAALVREFGARALGLSFPSERDASIEPFVLAGCGPNEPIESALARQSSAKGEIRVSDARQFFRPAVEAKPWHNDRERRACQRMRALVGALESNLDDVRAYRVGSGAEADVYVLGRTRGGAVVGVRTRVVET